MPKRTVLETVVVFRDGERKVIHPEKPPKAFDFSAEELEDIKKANPKAVRKPINESGDHHDDDADDRAKGTSSGAQASLPTPASNASGVNTASGAAQVSNANKPAGSASATTSASQVSGGAATDL